MVEKQIPQHTPPANQFAANRASAARTAGADLPNRLRFQYIMRLLRPPQRIYNAAVSHLGTDEYCDQVCA